jgi:hypothetical protein
VYDTVAASRSARRVSWISIARWKPRILLQWHGVQTALSIWTGNVSSHELPGSSSILDDVDQIPMGQLKDETRRLKLDQLDKAGDGTRVGGFVFPHILTSCLAVSDEKDLGMLYVGSSLDGVCLPSSSVDEGGGCLMETFGLQQGTSSGTYLDADIRLGVYQIGGLSQTCH